jgi:hypothetical protein
MLYININFNIINYLRNKLFYKNKATLFILKELRYKDKIKRTYN